MKISNGIAGSEWIVTQKWCIQHGHNEMWNKYLLRIFKLIDVFECILKVVSPTHLPRICWMPTDAVLTWWQGKKCPDIISLIIYPALIRSVTVRKGKSGRKQKLSSTNNLSWPLPAPLTATNSLLPTNNICNLGHLRPDRSIPYIMYIGSLCLTSLLCTGLIAKKPYKVLRFYFIM